MPHRRVYQGTRTKLAFGTALVVAMIATAGPLRAGPGDEFHQGIQGNAIIIVDPVTGIQQGWACQSRSCSSRYCCSIFVNG